MYSSKKYKIFKLFSGVIVVLLFTILPVGCFSATSEISASSNVFFQHANEKSVLIFEPQPHHGECLPSYVKYFNEMGYHVDIFALPEIIKENPFVRLPKNSDYSIYEVPKNKRAEILKNKKILDYKHILISTQVYQYILQNKVFLGKSIISF